ncbi:hypothetical protein LOTGIDRAFT_208933 [Lottia gigantea]|uniref:L-gulonolactone oxidase n=1 Tax=Lottia gigantea TaxID=225164 RepID=V4AKW8_LOTGI|nr:hypothetical protein LOTGIDRAFT_208933 [Lottia gigantea]ESO97787.1 hypothetical protein LOTGIDRAFT_208933 [Lottia gigantea]
MTLDIRSLGKPGYKFTNWATTYSCYPELYFEPETTDEIRQILAFAQKKGKKVKVVGNGHSPSDLACTTDFMISLKRYNRVLQVDKESRLVRVQGGCLIKDLNERILPANGLAFTVQGTVSDLTAAGVISTGTHGTGHDFGIISTFVREIELMQASGEVLTISRDLQNTDLFPAACVSLGALGVILSVTFKCEAAFNLEQTQFPNSLNNVLENLDEYVTGSDHFRFFYFPYTNSTLCFNANRTSKPKNVKSSWFWETLVGYHIFQFFYWLGAFITALVPVVNRLLYRVIYAHKSEKVDRSDHIFNFNCLFKQYVSEWSIPREKTSYVLKEIQKWIIDNNFPAHVPIEVRFVKGDDLYLSPAYGWKDTCYINIIMYTPFNKIVPREKYWKAFEKIMSDVGGRPHWAKDHKYGREEFQNLYPQFDTFCKIRERLDPNGMFLNSNLERVFGNSSNSIFKV